MVKIAEDKYYYKVDGYEYAEKLLEGFYFDVWVNISSNGTFAINVGAPDLIGIDMDYWRNQICEGETKKIDDIIKSSTDWTIYQYLEAAGDMSNGEYGLDW